MLGAPYSVSEEYFMCTTSICTVAWDVKYDSTNDYSHTASINTTLSFLDTAYNNVPVGLLIEDPARKLSGEDDLLGGLSDCTRMEEIMIEYAGVPLLDNIDDEIVSCENQVQVGVVYYVSFPDEDATTFTQAKFSNLSPDNIVLECSISGQESGSEWNFAELC